MFALSILFCASVLFSVDDVFASDKYKDCVDCRSFRLCESAIKYARKHTKVTNEIREFFAKAICGHSEDGPKICCSDFEYYKTTSDIIETHPNLALLPNHCGEIFDDRIYPGRIAHLYSYPWMALIGHNTSDGRKFSCAGSIINSRYILTAAHCVSEGGDVKKIDAVRLGDHDVSRELDCQGEGSFLICESKIQDLLVEDIIVHENYTGYQPVQADIALIRLRTNIDFSAENVAPVCLPVNKYLLDYSLEVKKVKIAGWGLTDASANPTVLLQVIIPTLNEEECQQYFYRYQDRGRVKNIFCAGALKMNKNDSCAGDSGGPVLTETYYNDYIRYVQYGIISRNPIPCNTTYPGVYTDVTKYMDWILEKIKN